MASIVARAKFIPTRFEKKKKYCHAVSIFNLVTLVFVFQQYCETLSWITGSLDTLVRKLFGNILSSVQQKAFYCALLLKCALAESDIESVFQISANEIPSWKMIDWRLSLPIQWESVKVLETVDQSLLFLISVTFYPIREQERSYSSIQYTQSIH